MIVSFASLGSRFSPPIVTLMPGARLAWSAWRSTLRCSVSSMRLRICSLEWNSGWSTSIWVEPSTRALSSDAPISNSWSASSTKMLSSSPASRSALTSHNRSRNVVRISRSVSPDNRSLSTSCTLARAAGGSSLETSRKMVRAAPPLSTRTISSRSVDA